MNASLSVVIAGLVVALFVSLQACTDPAVTEPDPSDSDCDAGALAALALTGKDSVVLGAAATMTATLMDGCGDPMVGRDVTWSSHLVLWINPPRTVGRRDLGTTTTDANGMAGIELVPPTLGTHAVMAAFGDTAVGHYVQVAASTTPHPALQWEGVAPMPSKRQQQSAVALDGLIYLVGGRCDPSWIVPEDTCPDPSTFIYDPASDNWWEGAAPAAFGVGVAAAVAGRIHFLTWGDGMPTHERYDPTLDEWAVLGPPPDSAEIFHGIGDLLYMVGVTGATWAFDPGTGLWTARAPITTPRFRPASTVLDGRIYVAGGVEAVGDYSDADDGVTDLERYDSGTDAWITLAPLPFPRHHASAGVLDGEICVFGGGLRTSVDVWTWPETWCYDPAADAWDFGPLMSQEPQYWVGFGVAGSGNGSAVHAFGGGWMQYKTWVFGQTSATRRLTLR
jgi:hypothetical protein